MALAPGRSVRAREILLVEDHLLDKAGAAPAMASLGHEMPTQPAACIFFCQATRFSRVSR